jgi:hypothetical protein
MKKALISTFVLCAALGAVYAQENTLTESEKAEGFKLLFDGTTIESFRTNFVEYQKGNTTNTGTISTQWRVDATNKCVTSGSSQPDLRSKEILKDIDMRMSYRNDANQGVFYRCLATTSSIWESCVETAIEDNTDIANQKTAAGAIYDMFAPAVKNYNPYSSGKWNDLRIVVKDDSIEHWMNGARIISAKYHNTAWWAAYDKSKWTGFNTYCMKKPGDHNGGPIPEGYWGIQGNHGGKWMIRNLRINSTSANIKFGPVSTGLKAVSQPSVAPSYSVERTAGASALRFKFAKVDRVSVLSLDGREVLRSAVDADSRTASLAGLNKAGIYLVRATAGGKTVFSDKIFLQ